jgi:hypothetical protein
MRKIIFPLFLCASFSLALLSSCSSSLNHRSSSYAYSPSKESSYKTEDESGTDVSLLEVPDRKLIYDADIDITVKKPDTANVQLIRIARKYNGYVLSTGTNYTTIRVKADSLQFALTEIARLGKVKKKSIYAEDVTEQYSDLTIRLDNATKARIRYLELLAKAANVSETLLVEKELERLNKDIDLLEGKMNKMNHLLDYSTITVHVEKRIKPGPLGFVFKYLYKGVKFLFVWG